MINSYIFIVLGIIWVILLIRELEFKAANRDLVIWYMSNYLITWTQLSLKISCTERIIDKISVKRNIILDLGPYSRPSQFKNFLFPLPSFIYNY